MLFMGEYETGLCVYTGTRSQRLPGFLLLLSAALLYQYPFPAAAADTRPQPLSALCNTTTNPTLCLSTLSSYPSSQPSALLQDLTDYVVSAALVQVNRTYWIGERDKVASEKSTLQDCLELLDDSLDGLNRSANRLRHLDAGAPPDSLRAQVMDVRVWLSASLTYLETCWDELADPKAAAVKKRLSKASQGVVEPLLSIALCLAQTLQQQGGASTSYALPRHPP
eukprot:c6830_g1_i1 orf=1-669(-)